MYYNALGIVLSEQAVIVHYSMNSTITIHELKQRWKEISPSYDLYNIY